MDFYRSNPQDLSTLDLPLIDLLMVMVGKIDWDEFLNGRARLSIQVDNGPSEKFTPQRIHQAYVNGAHQVKVANGLYVRKDFPKTSPGGQLCEEGGSPTGS